MNNVVVGCPATDDVTLAANKANNTARQAVTRCPLATPEMIELYLLYEQLCMVEKR